MGKDRAVLECCLSCDSWEGYGWARWVLGWVWVHASAEFVAVWYAYAVWDASLQKPVVGACKESVGCADVYVPDGVEDGWWLEVVVVLIAEPAIFL